MTPGGYELGYVRAAPVSIWVRHQIEIPAPRLTVRICVCVFVKNFSGIVNLTGGQVKLDHLAGNFTSAHPTALLDISRR